MADRKRSGFFAGLRARLGAGLFVLLAVVSGCGGSSAPGGSMPASGFVDADWLAERLGDPAVRVVDSRTGLTGGETWEDGHIEGAVALSPYDLAMTRDGVLAQVTPREEARAMLVERGLDYGATIIVYGEPPEFDPARIVWALRYYGYADVRMLDGGIAAWQAAGYGLATEPTAPAAGAAFPEVGADVLRVTGDELLEVLDEPADSPRAVQIVDARSDIEYATGRIPGAVHIQWGRNLDEDGLLRPLEELAEIHAGLDPQRTTVVYCLAGWRASLGWLALVELGFEDVRVYDGSWYEWGADARFPVETD